MAAKKTTGKHDSVFYLDFLYIYIYTISLFNLNQKFYLKYFILFYLKLYLKKV